MEQIPPPKIGRFVIQRELGRGAMGVVYEAQDPAIGRTVAVKSIRIGEISDPRERQRIKDRIFREAQSAGVLSHPHIVTIYDIQEADNVVYIFMEYIDGSTLEKLLLDETPPDKNLVLALLRQTAAAMDFAHSKGIIHRDIKPANVMVRQDWTAKIADFGIAKTQSQSLTQTGLVVGTPNYMSPEQIQGKAVDGRADQFSLGVIAYEVLTGEKPFVADTLPTLLFKLVSEPAVSAVRLNPSLNPSIDAVLQKALSKDPAQRWDSCSAFITALEQQCGRHPGWAPQTRGQAHNAATAVVPASPVAPAPPSTPTPSTPTPADPKPQPNRTPLFAATGLAAALVLAVALWQLTKRPGPAPETAPPASATIPTDTKTSPAPGTSSPPKAKDAPPPPKTAPVSPKPTDSTPATEPCTTPCNLELPAGRHVLLAQLDKYETANRIFMLPAEAQVNINLRRETGTVAVSSTPPGAQILVDGVEHPEKTPAILTLPTGRHKITVTLPGRGEKSRDVNVEDGAQLDYSVNFGGN
ncbi:MAG: serine/threonine protein kinase [Acidobacteria bacterium]|nr:serine/threonine protein kinase [Acidobacteriota bacterium]